MAWEKKKTQQWVPNLLRHLTRKTEKSTLMLSGRGENQVANVTSICPRDQKSSQADRYRDVMLSWKYPPTAIDSPPPLYWLSPEIPRSNHVDEYERKNNKTKTPRTTSHQERVGKGVSTCVPSSEQGRPTGLHFPFYRLSSFPVFDRTRKNHTPPKKRRNVPSDGGWIRRFPVRTHQSMLQRKLVPAVVRCELLLWLHSMQRPKKGRRGSTKGEKYRSSDMDTGC